MKRNYSKPEIMFESFLSNTSIAGTCGYTVGLPTQGTCGVPGSAPNMNIFSSSMTGIDGCQSWNDSGIHDGHCYHAPDGYPAFFNS